MPHSGPLKIKAQVLCGDEFAIGPGKADLLEAIERVGSISGAGRELGMSYRRAWMLVDTMNRSWSAPLVEATAGGGELKGARLTACGHEVLAAFRTLEQALLSAAPGKALKTLSALVLAQPRPAQRRGRGEEE